MADFTAEQMQEWGAEPYQPPSFSAEEVADWDMQDITPSAVGSFLRRGLIEAPAGAAAGVAGVAAAIPGAAAGTAVGGPVGGVVGGLATGVPAAMAVGAGAHALQDKLLDMLGLREGTGPLSRAQEYADRATNEYSTFAGELAGNTLPSFGVGAGRMVGQRVFGAGLQAGMEAGSEAYRGEEFDKGKIAMSGVAGAAFAAPRRWMNPITKPIEQRFGVQPPQAPPARPEDNTPLSTDVYQATLDDAGSPLDKAAIDRLNKWLPPKGGGYETGTSWEENLNRDFPPVPPEAGRTQPDYGTRLDQDFPRIPENMRTSDMAPVDPGLAGPTPKQQELAFAQQQARAAEPGAIRDYWDAHVRALQEVPFTTRDSDKANDITTTARGVAAENPPAPQIEGAGNPLGAPMQGRVAQRPNGPGRNYSKGWMVRGSLKPPRTGELPENPGKPQLGNPKYKAGELPNEDIISADPIHADVRAALEAQAQPKNPEVTGAVTKPPEPGWGDKLDRDFPRMPPETPRPVTPPPAEPAPAPPQRPTLSLPQRPPRPPAAQAAINAGQVKRGPRPTFTIDALSTPKPVTPPAEQVPPRGPLAREVASQHMPAYDMGYEGKPLPGHANQAERANDRMNVDRAMPAPKAPAEHPSIAQARELLAKHPVKEAADIFEKLPPAQQLKAAKKIVSELPKLMENQRLEKHRQTVDLGDGRTVQTGGGDRGARKIEAARVMQDAVAEVNKLGWQGLKGDQTKASRKAIQEHARMVFDSAKKKFGGEDPSDRTVGYRPQPPTPAYNVVAAARRVATKPTPKNETEYLKALVLGGDIGKNVDADIAMKRRPSVEDVQGSTAQDASRVMFDHEPVFQEGKDNTYAEQWKAAQDFVNEATPEQYRTLDKEFDLGAELNEPAEPGELLQKFKQALTDAEAKREVRIPVRNKMDLERIEAPRGRSIDPNSAEGKAILAGRSVEAMKTAPKRSKGEAATERAKADVKLSGLKNAESEGAQDRSPSMREQVKSFFGDEKGALNISRIKSDLNRLKMGATDLVARATLMTHHLTQRDYAAVVREATPLLPEHVTAAETSGDKDLWQTFGRMLGDESGALNINQLKNLAPSWMLNLRHSFLTPGPVVRDAVHDYASGMVGWFTRLSNTLSAFKDTLIVNASHARFADGSLLSDAESKQIHDAFEKGTVNALPGKLKDYADSYVKPMLDKYKQMYVDYKARMTALALPGWDTLPNPHSNGNGYNEFFPRFLKGSAGWETNDTINPTSGQSLGYWAATAQERGYFALQNAAGDRLVFTPGDDSITILRNGAPQKVMVSGVDTGQVGNTLSLKVKGKTDTWTIDHPGRAEITKEAGKDVNGNDKFVYHDHPVLAMSNAIYGLNNATERLKLYEKLINDPFFQANQLPSHKAFEAREKGWVQTELPPWKDKGTFFPKHIAWALDDFNYRGFKLGEGNTFKVALDKFAGDTAKLFYFFGPLVHAFNEADKWLIGRGWDNITPRGLRSLGVNGAKALKDSLSKDRPLEREMRDAGANLMYLHAITTQTMPKIARQLGVQIGKEPWKYDPIAKLFGVSTKQMASAAYDLSNRSMWWLTDVLAKQRYLEMKDFHKGISNEEAVVKMHDFVDSYVVGPTVGGKGDAGRTFKKFMSDPSLSLFGAYHRGLYHSLAKMTSGLLGPRSTMKERVEASGQWAVAAAMMYAVYPALSYAYSQLTGDKHSEFERRGVSRLLGTGKDVSSGDKGFQDILRNVWTPSTPAAAGIQQMSGMDWKGKPIISAQNFREPRKFAKMLGQEGEFLASSFVSPYKTISQAAEKPGATPGSVAGHFLESNFGLKTPSAAANKHKAQEPKLQARDARQREKHPGGLIESVVNRATKRSYGQ